MIEINIKKLQKAERGTHKGPVRVTRAGKTHIEQRRVGRKSGRAGTGKIDKLPQNIRDTIIELRRLNYSGQQIKDNIETIIEASDNEIRKKLIDANVIKEIKSELTVTPQALVDYAKKHGAESKKKRKTVATVEKEAEERWKDNWNEINAKNSELTGELQDKKDELQATKEDIKNKNKLRDKLRSDLMACREELKR